MPRRTSKTKQEIKIEAYSHMGKKRKNNPPVGLVSSQTDKINGYTKYAHDPHVDPYLSWAGKQEGQEVNVRNISLHVHERIDPTRVIRSFLKSKTDPTQPSLFQAQENTLPLGKAFEFYSHDQDWTNRLISGDSLLVTNSLLKKEGMAGQVQMIYIDPPYGIKYNSNFQPFVNNREVKDNNDADIPAEPETIKAFRDTWELGIHSYLTYLYNQLLLAKELLHDSGSCFVQISDENVHHVRELMDQVFGKDNFFSLVTFKKTLPLGSSGLAGISDYIIWYAKDIKKIKYHNLFEKKGIGKDTGYTWVELADGTRHKMTKEEKNDPSILPKDARPFFTSTLSSSGFTESCYYDFEFEGKVYHNTRKSWRTHKEGMMRLLAKKRIMAPANLPCFVQYYDDFPYQPLHNLWDDTHGEIDATYVVQTSRKVIERCLLMTTDPGDLVFDPTCGSGTTAFVAEEWGRRWITCDTSRVAITLAKQRMMTAYFDYYKLAHQNEGVSSGFEYKKVPHITLGSIANNEQANEETLYDQPLIDKSKIRVTGPFTVEALPSLRTKPFDGKEAKIIGTGEELARSGETANQNMWRDELKISGIRGTGGKILNFSRIEPMAGTRFLHAEGEILDEQGINKKAVISFGPDYGALEQRQAEEAINEARELAEKPDFVIFAAFQFDPEAAKDIDQIKWPSVTILRAQMSVDLLTSDLRKKRSSNQSYWLIGQPDVEVVKNKDNSYKVFVRGFDYYNPVTGEIDSGDTARIAMWMLDTDYDEQSILPEAGILPHERPKA